MRRSHLRFASAVLLAVLCARLVVWCDEFAAAQQPKSADKKGKEKDDDKDKDLRPAGDNDLPFGFEYQRDARRKLEAARDYLAYKDPPWNTVCPLLQNILDIKSDSFFNITDKAGEKSLTRRISVRKEADRILSEFPKEGLEFYQQSYGQVAAALLDDAVKNNYDLMMLTDLSRRYFHTRAGAEGTVLLGSIYLERGNYVEAADTFERLLTRPRTDEFLTPRVLFRAALAFRRSNDPRHAALFGPTAERLYQNTARNGLTIGRKVFTAEQVRAEFDRPVGAVTATSTVGAFNTHRGNAQRNGLVNGGPPFLVPAFRPVRMLFTGLTDTNTWIDDELSRVFDRENRSNTRPFPLPGFFPVTTPDLVIYRAYDGVYAVATRDHSLRGELQEAGKVVWVAPTDFGLHQLVAVGDENAQGDTSMRDQATQWWGSYKASNASGLIAENPLIGSLSHDGQNVYFVDDVAIPPPPTPQNVNGFGGIGGFPDGGGVQKQSGRLAHAVRAGELVALDMTTGLRVWSLGRVIPGLNDTFTPPPPLTEEEADKETSAFRLCLSAVFLGPPLPLNGRLYVLIESDGIVRLLCLDPKTLVEAKDWHLKVPALLWAQKIGKPHQAVAAEPTRRYQGAFLAASEGVLVCPTNSGAVVGVDIMSRSLLWAHAYRKLEAVDPRRAMGFDPNTGQRVYAQPLPVDRWRAAAPVVSNGRVVVAAYDSKLLDCLDVRTGRLLWSVNREPGDLYVGGVVNDTVIVVGKTEVRGIRLTRENPDTLEPKLAWKAPLTGVQPTGQGAAGTSAYYIPVRPEGAGRGLASPAEIWAVDAATGAVLSKTAARQRDGAADLAKYGLGNLVFQDGQVIAQSAFEVAVYPQLELKKAEMDRKLAANPKDPEGLFNRGELLLDDGKLKEAVADFKEAERNMPADAVAAESLRRRLREKLYLAYTELLQANFAAAEHVLPEYAALCEVPLDGADEAFERRRREDETLRRKRLYLYLLARGREGQGRLGDAFDNYRSLAALGESKTLFELPDDPSVRMRPDVWARGRIEGMLRKAADPAARKTLEDRVNAEWDEVRGRNDLDRLREFVAVFGGDFPAGAAAELKLADALAATNNDDDTREAQIHLARLRAAAGDPAVRAAATESLAALMVRNGLMEDAVGLYLQLGKEFPDVAVRDSKTGTDYVNDLLTDKRLLPYLEPARSALPARVKVEARRGQQVVNQGAVFDVEPVGDLFPMYRRLRFVMDLASSGNGTWTLRGYDRTTGVEQYKSDGMANPQIQNPGMLAPRFVQASGHLIMVHLGSRLYCFDLAEKVKRWEVNLFGTGPAANPTQPRGAIRAGDVEEITYQTSDGTFFTIPVGRWAVIQPNYVAVLTRDGLEVGEPNTNNRRPLWTRRNVPEKCHLYGDARYVVMVEVGADGKPVSTKLLRAADGAAVEGAPDVGRVLGAARWFRLFGQTALLAEGAGDAPRVLRLLDLSTGKDVWRRQYDAKAVPVKALSPEWAGFVKPTGEVEIVSAKTGQPVGAFTLDADRLVAHLDGCVEAQLLADADRFYLTLDREAAANRRLPTYGYGLRTLPVNGPVYCFDRATGARRWYTEDVFDHQAIILDRFAEMPVLAAASSVSDARAGFRVVVVEKERGLLRLNESSPYDNQSFHHLTVDPKNKTVDLQKYNLRVHIRPDDTKPGGE